MINFSIVIPHHNAPDLLKRLLNTIPNREDLEIIIVDDNSDPQIVDFNNFPGINRNNLICILTKEGLGAGYARNIGLDNARGKWLYFADADDYFTPHFNNFLDKYANENQYDVVFVNAIALNENGLKQPFPCEKYISNYLSGRKRALDVLRFSLWTPWSRMIKRKLFTDNKIRFEHVKIGNDMMAIIQTSIAARTFKVEPSVIYIYYKPTSGSLTSNFYKTEPSIERIEQRIRLNKLYEDIKYPYLWPIPSLRKIQPSSQIKQLKKKYHYSVLKEIINTIRFYFARIRGIV